MRLFYLKPFVFFISMHSWSIRGEKIQIPKVKNILSSSMLDNNVKLELLWVCLKSEAYSICDSSKQRTYRKLDSEKLLQFTFFKICCSFISVTKCQCYHSSTSCSNYSFNSEVQWCTYRNRGQTSNKAALMKIKLLIINSQLNCNRMKKMRILCVVCV